MLTFSLNLQLCHENIANFSAYRFSLPLLHSSRMTKILVSDQRPVFTFPLQEAEPICLLVNLRPSHTEAPDSHYIQLSDSQTVITNKDQFISKTD